MAMNQYVETAPSGTDKETALFFAMKIFAMKAALGLLILNEI